MSQQLINHNADLKQLQEEGFEIAVKGAFLIVSNIPYVNSKKEINYGKLVVGLSINGLKVLKPHTHVAYFNGDHPCRKDGSILSEISLSSNRQYLTEGVEINHSFSNKPPGGYGNYYEQISRYSEIIAAPAKSIDCSVTEKTFRVNESISTDVVHKYTDTNSSRAGISSISEKVKNQRVGIIGLGGTGSYLLDLISKTPVKEIHLFDADEFVQHNAFRSPGAASVDELNKRMFKVDYFCEKYSAMHSKIFAHNIFINEATICNLSNFDFVFICIDTGGVKKLIFDFLNSQKISYIDVGIGLEIVDEKIIGIVRTTSASEIMREHVTGKVSFADNENDLYSSNIQIAELNALNATLAIIKWKKMAGIYQDLNHEHHSVYTLNVDSLIGDDYAA